MTRCDGGARSYGVAALLFSLAAPMWLVAGVIGEDTALCIAIGMMHACVALMFLGLGRRRSGAGRKPEPRRDDGA